MRLKILFYTCYSTKLTPLPSSRNVPYAAKIYLDRCVAPTVW